MNSDKSSPPVDWSSTVELLTIDKHHDAQRIDNFLITHWKGVPKSHIYRLLRKGEIRLNKKRVKPETRLRHGDLLRLPPVRRTLKSAAEAPGSQLLSLVQSSVLYEDQNFLVVNKPQGLAVHAGTGNALGFVEALRWHYKTKDDLNDYLELAHRIDKETSGCLVLAKNTTALKYIQAEFKERRVSKIYLALVHGHWSETMEQVDAPLQKIEISAKEKVVKVSADGKQSLTRFRIIKKMNNATLVEARPETGRMHQIRVHCQYAGHPIVGDPKYTMGQGGISDLKHRLCLHAASIRFELPSGGGTLFVEAPINSAMSSSLEEFSRITGKPR
jgi:23S rRNA pseudouridine955/2504/2580 synthase